MKVRNREGESLDVSYDEIKRRILRLCTERETQDVDIDHVIIQTINGIYDGITTYELDDLSARVCATLQSVHHTYDVIAAKIIVSNVAKSVRRVLASAGHPPCFSGKVAYLASELPQAYDPAFVAFVRANAAQLDAMICYERDAQHTYFALRTLERSYLMRLGDLAIESPQDMWMRVAVVLHLPRADASTMDVEAQQWNVDGDAGAAASMDAVMMRIHSVYDHMSRGDYTHATPTLFNAGMRFQQCSSCFVADTEVATVNAGSVMTNKKIQDVVVGDLVVTHKGNVRPVTQLHRNPLGDRMIHRLRVTNRKDVFVTGNHRFWAMTRSSCATTGTGVSWIPAEELRLGDWMVAPMIRDGSDATASTVELDGVDSSPSFFMVTANDPMPDLRPEVVYTLGVEEDHSYAVEGLMAENCYLLGTDDSLSGIFKTLSDCAQISKWAGGIGLHVSNVRAKGSTINSTNGRSDGIIPMLKVYNETARYCNQSGRRKGSIAVYLEPWHADVWEFVELRRNTGAETERARDLFLALWVPDEFMRRVVADEDWYLMSPDVSPGLIDAIGDAFTVLYAEHVAAGRFVRKIRARELWTHVITSQIETGTPYVCYKDHVNRKSNLINVGVVRSSNLCSEITLPSDADSYAVCNLASIAVNRFFLPATGAQASQASQARGTIDHARLHDVAKEITRNLNRVIDINSYPTVEARRSNMALRPLGIGVQGFGDLYCMMRLPYDDARAMRLDAEVMETIHHGALEASVELAEALGPYSRFEGSPASQGVLQMDLWARADAASAGGEAESSKEALFQSVTDRYDWDEMRARVMRSGMRNSLLVALMPTASTSQILGNGEAFEVFQSNVFKRSTLAGEFLVVNRHLQRDLMALSLWDDDMRKRLLADDGSVQGNPRVPDDLKRVYRTVWEVSQRSVIDHAVARGPFVCQSQSMNLYMTQPTVQRLSSALVYAWQQGLKTGMYYLRSTAAVEAIKYGVSASGGGGSGGGKSSQSQSQAQAPPAAAAAASGPGGDVALTPPPPRSKCDPNSDVCLMCSS
jgi:ribonucleoside-diphosphate reductase alpha subunit